VVNLLKKAKKLLERPYGWTQHTATSKVKRCGHTFTAYCAFGAICYSDQTYRKSFQSPLSNACANILRSIAGDNLIVWNDKPGRSKRQVISLFSKTIKAVNNNEVDLSVYTTSN
jgi:hypothetical protein